MKMKRRKIFCNNLQTILKISDAVEHGADQAVDRIFIPCIGLTASSVGNYETTSHGFVTQKAGESGYGRAFHFKVCDT